MKANRRSLVAALSLSFFAPLVMAQGDYPTKPVKIIVPYGAGGGTDAIVRAVSEPLSKALGQPVIVENKPGGGTTIGASEVARAAPDGYTFLWGDNTALALAPFLHKNLSYSPLDFTPVTQTVVGTLILAVSPELGINSVQDLIDYAKANPGKLAYASAGNGTPHHLAMEMFKSRAGVDMIHIPYKGESPGLTDLIGGRVQLMFAGPRGVKIHADEGRLKLLAASGDRRHFALPELPTVAEVTDMKDFDASYWHALVAPANTPQPIVQKMLQAYEASLKDPRVIQFVETGGTTLVVTSPEALSDHLRKQAVVSENLVTLSGLKID